MAIIRRNMLSDMLRLTDEQHETFVMDREIWDTITTRYICLSANQSVDQQKRHDGTTESVYHIPTGERLLEALGLDDIKYRKIYNENKGWYPFLATDPFDLFEKLNDKVWHAFKRSQLIPKDTRADIDRYE